jgi:hypothetical protein
MNWNLKDFNEDVVHCLHNNQYQRNRNKLKANGGAFCCAQSTVFGNVSWFFGLGGQS